MGNIRKTTTIRAAALTTTMLTAIAVTAPIQANAADLLIDPPVIEAPIVEAKSGWYLRGDVSYDYQELRGAFAYAGASTVDYKTASVEDAFDLGVGIGYQVSDYLRVDATADYVFEADFNGSLACFDRPAGAFPGTQGCGADEMTAEKGKVSTLKLMANAYVDLGHFNGLTPYVGAGIGGAYVKYTDYMQDAVTVFADGTTSSQMHTELDGDWRFAYALHAGVSYDLSHSLKLDVGYSYNHIAGGELTGYERNFAETRRRPTTKASTATSSAPACATPSIKG